MEKIIHKSKEMLFLIQQVNKGFPEEYCEIQEQILDEIEDLKKKIMGLKLAKNAAKQKVDDEGNN